MSGDSTKQEFLAELEGILESDEAYGSNIQILVYAIDDKAVSGKFKDSWNNRVYEFVIDENEVSYKPAGKFDSANADDLPARFDAYSEGYNSLLGGVRLDRNPIGKRVKKPKCGAEGYGCGFSCIGLTKTCRILSSGKKTRGEFQGKAIGKERLSKLIALSTKLAASGDKKKFAATNAVAAKIAKSREKYNIEGANKLFERRANKQFGYVPGAQSPSKAVEVATEAKQALIEKQAKRLVEHKQIPKVELAPNPKTHAIKNQKEFENVFLHVVDNLNKSGKNVPIHRVREAIGELVPRDKFNEYVKDFQDKGLIQFTSGSGSQSSNLSEKEYATAVSNSISTKVNGLRFFMNVDQKAKDKIDNTSDEQRTKAKNLLKDRPELDPVGSARQYSKGDKITSQKEFDDVAEKVFKALDEEFNQGGLVPIAKVKDVLKNRVPNESLDKMLFGFQNSDKYQLIGHGTLPGQKVPKELADGEVRTRTGDPRHYIKKLK